MAKKKISAKEKPIAKKKAKVKKVVKSKKSPVSTKKKPKKRKVNRYQKFFKLVSKWKKKNKVDFKGVNFHSVVSKMYQGIPKEEDILPIKDIDDAYLFQLFDKNSGIEKELPLSKLLPSEIDYWQLENYLEPIIDLDIYVDNSICEGEVDDYDGSTEEFVNIDWKQILSQLNNYIKENYPDEAERYHIYTWEVDESGKVIFTLSYSGVRAMPDEDIEKPDELVRPIVEPEEPKIEKPSELDKQLEIEKLKKENLEREIQLQKQQVELSKQQVKLEKEKQKTELNKQMPQIIKELKEAGFTPKEIKEFIKDLKK